MDEEISVQNVIDNLMSNPIGGEINSDATEIEGDRAIIHCWDGRRYELKIAQLPDGCAYDAETGNSIT